jgi:hypothetical protein
MTMVWLVILESLAERRTAILGQSFTPALSRELEQVDAEADRIWDELQGVA